MDKIKDDFIINAKYTKIQDDIIQELLDFINQPLPFDITIYTHKKFKTSPEKSLYALTLVEKHFHEIKDFQNDDDILAFFRELARENGLKNGQIMEPVRATLTNKRSSAGGAVELIHIFGKEEALQRIETAIQNINHLL